MSGKTRDAPWDAGRSQAIVPFGAFAFLKHSAAKPSIQLEVSILGKMRTATVLGEAVLDPADDRLNG